MLKDLLEWSRQFAHDQGIMALLVVGLLLFGGKVLWGMDMTLDQHAANDTESIRLLRVICLSVAKDDAWRQACVDAKFDADRLAERINGNNSGSARP